MGTFDPKTGLYDGAIGLIQRGEADLIPVPMYYPLKDANDEYFDYSHPIMEDEMMIICAYNTTVGAKDKDILQMFTSVQVTLWYITLAAFLTFILLLTIGYKVLGVGHKYKAPSWMVTCAFLSEDNFPEDTPFNRVITVTACLFLFFFGNYLFNSMSSDLIVYDKPRVIASYADALARVAEGSKLFFTALYLKPKCFVNLILIQLKENCGNLLRQWMKRRQRLDWPGWRS